MTPRKGKRLTAERLAEVKRWRGGDRSFSVAELIDHIAAIEAENARLTADYAAIAHAVDIEYVADGHASAPGPVDVVLRVIGELKGDSAMKIDADVKARELEAENARLREALDATTSENIRILASMASVTRTRQALEMAMCIIEDNCNDDGHWDASLREMREALKGKGT